MPVSEALRRLSEIPAFWLGEPLTGGEPMDGGESPEQPAELRVSFPVTGGYALVLDLDLSSGDRALGLRGPASSDPLPLGFAPAEGPVPAALRWWELDLCARVIAWEDPTIPHPGLVVALLSPFAPATAEDDETAIAAVREAAYRSLRREVPPTPPSGPEQTPLPLFSGDDWWPAPERLSPEVLDEATIAALSHPPTTGLEVRTGKRFPREEMADLVRRAKAHLDRLPDQSWNVGTRPLVRRILDSGDLRPVPELLGALTEAGCDHPTVLDALSEPLVTVEACWMVETLAGARPGTLLRRRV